MSATPMPRTTPSTFYRFRGFNAHTLRSLCSDTLYFANPDSFNDPLDCRPSVDCDIELGDLRDLLSLLIRKRAANDVITALTGARLKGPSLTAHSEKHACLEASRVLDDIAYHSTNPEYKMGKEEAEVSLLTQAIEREVRARYGRGVCCFSETYACPLLWSHYGDQHRGMCIGYDLERKPRPKLQKVSYGRSRSVLTSTLLKAFKDGSEAAQQQLDRDILLRKASCWKYEKEWRLVGAQGVQDSPLRLTEITFGLRCDCSIMYTVVQALSGRTSPVKFYEIREDAQGFKLPRSPLNVCELQHYFPKTAISGPEAGFDPIEDD